MNTYIGRPGPNLEPGTKRVYATDGPRNGFNIGKKGLRGLGLTLNPGLTSTTRTG